jgi:hypothetical protein
MIPPPRLLDVSSNDFELAALRAAASDRGSPAAFLRVLSVTSAAPLGAHVPALGKLSSAVLKAMLAGSVVGVGAVALSAGIHGITRSASPEEGLAHRTLTRRAANNEAEPSADRQAVSGHAARSTLDATPVSSSAGVLPSEPVGRSRQAVKAAAPAMAGSVISTPSAERSAPPAGSELSREIELLDLARRQLASGDSAGALSTLARRERELTQLSLGPEALVVQVKALLASGQRARATAIAESAIARDPQGSYAQRLRRALNTKAP